MLQEHCWNMFAFSGDPNLYLEYTRSRYENKEVLRHEDDIKIGKIPPLLA